MKINLNKEIFKIYFFKNGRFDFLVNDYLNCVLVFKHILFEIILVTRHGEI